MKNIHEINAAIKDAFAASNIDARRVTDATELPANRGSELEVYWMVAFAHAIKLEDELGSENEHETLYDQLSEIKDAISDRFGIDMMVHGNQACLELLYMPAEESHFRG